MTESAGDGFVEHLMRETAEAPSPLQPSPSRGLKLTGVSGVFCASHYPKGGAGPLHGHTWQVIAWFDMGDAEALRDKLHFYLRQLDHSHLPDAFTWGEDLAELIGVELGAVRVQCNRPLENIYAEWAR